MYRNKWEEYLISTSKKDKFEKMSHHTFVKTLSEILDSISE